MKFKESDYNFITNNIFVDPGLAEFNLTTENLVTGNTGLEYAELDVSEDSCFAEGSDSGYEPIC